MLIGWFPMLLMLNVLVLEVFVLTFPKAMAFTEVFIMNVGGGGTIPIPLILRLLVVGLALEVMVIVPLYVCTTVGRKVIVTVLKFPGEILALVVFVV